MTGNKTNFQQIILNTTSRVTRSARSVQINPAAARTLAKHILLEEELWLTSKPQRDRQYASLFSSDDEYAQWLFVLDALNFSFWNTNEEKRWRWPATSADEHSDKGAVALGHSLRDAHARGVPLTDAAFLERLTPEILSEIIGGSGVLPMMKERCSVLNEVGQVLNHVYDGQVISLIEHAKGDVNCAVARLIKDFPSFRDMAILDGRCIYFLKRAQIFISDLWLVMGDETAGQFENIESLTAFADYKLPQFLRAAGVLAYSEDLALHVDNRIPIQHASREEVEIRAATVQAVELLRSQLESETGRTVFTCKLDNCLWALSHSPEFESHAPHHLTRTIYY